MKNAITIILTVWALLLCGCSNDNAQNQIKFATNADYPPFEYQEQGELKGFDIELAQLIAKKLGKKAVFTNVSLATILPLLDNNTVDAAIATMSITEKRQENYDFSLPYYASSAAALYIKEHPITSKEQLVNKKIACQLGSSMEQWVKQQELSDATIIAFDMSNQAVEAVKAGQADVAVLDEIQAKTFSEKNPELSYTSIVQLDAGYGIVFKKGSPLREQANRVLETLQAEGELDRLKQKWFGNGV